MLKIYKRILGMQGLSFMSYSRGGQSAARGPHAALHPKIFCGPCVKIWMHNSAIYDEFMYENTQNLHQFTSLGKKK